MTDFSHHTPKLLTEADAAADLAGVPRPSMTEGLPSTVSEKPEQAMANYTLTIVADSGYESTTEGRCSAVQYGAAMFVLHSEGVDLVALSAERDALAVRVRELEAALKPNLFWNDADPEHGETSIFEVIDSEWNGGCMKHGDEMVIQQAVRLPNIRVRLIPCPTDGDDYFDYEVIDAALTTPESKP